MIDIDDPQVRELTEAYRQMTLAGLRLRRDWPLPPQEVERYVKTAQCVVYADLEYMLQTGRQLSDVEKRVLARVVHKAMPRLLEGVKSGSIRR